MEITNVEVYGLIPSVIASSYPMKTNRPNEWEFEEEIQDICMLEENNKRLTKAFQLGSTPKGEGHDNFLNGIIVQFDVDFTIKAWTEAERYHFLDFVSSMSTMHKLTKFNLDEAYVEHVDPRIIRIVKQLQAEYHDNPTKENKLKLLYSNPVGMKLTARMTTNYRQLKTIYSQRFNHGLPEWREFCEWVLTLPYFKELTGKC
jgi:hypothetical protein